MRDDAEGIVNRKILAALCEVTPALTASQGLKAIKALRAHLPEVFAMADDPMFLNAADTLNALECLVARFVVDRNTEKATGNFCNCNQFMDQDDCRHAMAIRAVEKSKGLP